MSKLTGQPASSIVVLLMLVELTRLIEFNDALRIEARPVSQQLLQNQDVSDRAASSRNST
jgi:hypothetical protein